MVRLEAVIEEVPLRETGHFVTVGRFHHHDATGWVGVQIVPEVLRRPLQTRWSCARGPDGAEAGVVLTRLELDGRDGGGVSYGCGMQGEA